MRIVTCTKHDAETAQNLPIVKSIKKQIKVGNIDDYCINYQNTKGLSERYNEAIEEFPNEILIFCHDDLYLTDIFLREKLEKAFKKFDVVGIAGSSDFSLNRERVAWHISPRESWSGSVEHPYKNGGSNETYWTYFGPTPRQVAIIDGLMMCVDTSKLNGARYQEEFTFDGYDTAFCLECLQTGLKIGVTNIHSTHLSHGEGIREERYKKVEEMLRQKYGKERNQK